MEEIFGRWKRYCEQCVMSVQQVVLDPFSDWMKHNLKSNSKSESFPKICVRLRHEMGCKCQLRKEMKVCHAELTER